MKQKGKLPGLTFSNDFISRDEALHVKFNMLIYSYLRHHLSESVVHELFRQVVEIEHFFIERALPFDLVNMNARLMKQYIQYCADRSYGQITLQSHLECG